MNLYLVQHGEAKSKEEDPERPLTERGREDVKAVGAFVGGEAGIKVRTVYHSGKTRARQTAEVLSAAVHPTHGVVESVGLNPLDDPAIWGGRLLDEGGDVILVGHLPHLSKLAAHLVCQDADQTVVAFRNGGVVCLGDDGTRDWSVRWVVIPELLV
jgi:phosphohistidine phosphatase